MSTHPFRLSREDGLNLSIRIFLILGVLYGAMMLGPLGLFVSINLCIMYGILAELKKLNKKN